jgi:hypothetical protein
VKRKRPQQNRVDHAEYRDVRANAQSEHENDNGGKRPVAAERTQGKA